MRHVHRLFGLLAAGAALLAAVACDRGPATPSEANAPRDGQSLVRNVNAGENDRIGVDSVQAQLLLARPAPPITLKEVLQAPEATTASWEALSGKVVVLFFWASWCPPCRQTIPRLNELAEKFEGQPVQFIAVTDEEPAAIAAFIGWVPIKAWVGLDHDRSMFKAYGIEAVPQTVLVNRQGQIAALTNPFELDAQIIENLLQRETGGL